MAKAAHLQAFPPAMGVGQARFGYWTRFTL